jgi:hypothetical protein
MGMECRKRVVKILRIPVETLAVAKDAEAKGTKGCWEYPD